MKANNMTYEQLRTEFTKESFRNKLKDTIENICVNCGTTEHIEYHHIVPLKNGGTNKLTNIVALCECCHYKAHDKTMMKNKNGGRPKAIEFNEAEPILHRYYNLEIGKSETIELLGINPKSKTVWERLTKEYKVKYNISNKFYNRIDLKNSQIKRIETMRNTLNTKTM